MSAPGLAETRRSIIAKQANDARNKKLSGRKRSKIASIAARARWDKPRAGAKKK